MSKVPSVILWRLALGVAALVFSSACGSTGCQGCTPTPIPGGFPQQHRFDNAMQVRIAPSGLSFVENNFENLVKMLVPTGLSFTIPPTDCSSPDQKLCCGTGPCTATMALSNVSLAPTPQSTLKLDMRATVKTTKIKYEKHVAVLGWFTCDVTYDSTAAAPPTLGLQADVNLNVQAADGNKLAIQRGTTTLQDFDCGDITLSGSWYCTVADWLCPLFKGMIQDQLIATVDSTVDGMLKSLPMGQEGRFDVASFLRAFSPRTAGVVDYFMWGGGYAEAENSGMSLGVMAGFRAAKANACVPDCEKAGATCAPPQKVAIVRSNAFRGAARPDGKAFDVGIGIDRQALDVAAYSMYSSGGLCLDVASQTLPQLSSDLFSLLIPSIKNLTGGQSSPMMLSVRPRNPPRVELGKGTYHKDSSGKIVIDDPLLKLKAKDFAAEVYVQVDERMVRLFTIVGDLEVPVLLYADALGNLQPMIGALDAALKNIRLENAELITEDTASLAKVFPTILAMAGSFLGSGFAPIELPAVQSLKLLLDGGSITTTDNNQVLAIFAKLGLVKTTSYTLPELRVSTAASIERLWAPPTEAFRVGPAFDPAGGPEVVVRLGARLPQTLAGQPVEYAYRLDGGFYHPWTTGERLVVRDPALWLQGRHTLDVMARVVDSPLTTDLAPVRLSFTIDTIAPQVRLMPSAGGVRAELRDAATPAEELELSWSIGGGPFSSYSRQRSVQAPEGAEVRVQVRDAAGNVTAATTLARASLPATAEPAEVAGAGGCAMWGRSPASALVVLGLLLLAALVTRRARPR
jgi:hypothetical protein